MLSGLVKKIIGSKGDRDVKKMMPLVEQINSFEERISILNESELQSKTSEFKSRLEKGESLDQILPEAFATVREAGKRVLGMRHYDVQMVGGIVLHQGKIAEMKTGEGKTLVATLPIYLNALTGKGVHVVTVNDYLAKRDSEWMGKLYRYLGLSVGNIIHGLDDRQRKQNYACDVIYGTNNEYGFDYLRDNMKYSLQDYVQRELHYALVDEVDSILIDESRTPLIISGPSEQKTGLYVQINQIIPSLKKETDFKIDEKSRTVVLTEEGVKHAEELLHVENLYDPKNIDLLHHVNQGLKAHNIFKLDVDYVVRDNKVIIVDEFTGRLMDGRRWSDGLHQAVEAKEGAKIESENQTLATITFQNYFRMYDKLAGMTGTADTEAPEFAKIYNLEVVVIPTNKPLARKDEADLIYKNEKAKFKAVVADIEAAHEQGQPVLVGTINIDKSESLGQVLKRRGISHNVLNAKNHEREAEIVAQAGRFGAVTIATNMAGRGTDIVLGGNPEFMTRAALPVDVSDEEFNKKLVDFEKQCEEEKKKVLEAGGLRIIGTERHESRRIDNQLRGRSGRQGDPGRSQFFISLEDDLMRIFGSERIATMMERLKMDEDEAIFHPWITKAIENAQKKVEGHNFDIRKSLLDFDDVMNKQRETVYTFRREILEQATIRDKFLDMIDVLVGHLAHEFGRERGDQFNSEGLSDRLFNFFDIQFSLEDLLRTSKDQDQLGEFIYNKVIDHFEERENKFSAEVMQHVLMVFMLQTLDALWKDHLLNMDHLRDGINLRGYGQKDPIMEYKREGFELFEHMMNQFYEDVVIKAFRVEIQEGEEEELQMEASPQKMSMGRGALGGGMNPQQNATPGLPQQPSNRQAAIQQQIQRDLPKVGRNDPCPCGSGKKYKKCHG